MSAYDSALIGPTIVRPAMGAGLSRDARLLNIEAYVWSRQHLTDGRIPAGSLRWVTDAEDPETLAWALVECGVWERDRDGWVIVGFLDTQMSAERVMAQRDSNRERYARYLAGQGGKRQRVGSALAPKGRNSQRVANTAASAVVSSPGRDNAAANAVDNDTDLKRSARSVPAASASAPAAAPRGMVCEWTDCPNKGEGVTYYKNVGMGVCKTHALWSDDPRIALLVPGMSWEEGHAVLPGFVVDQDGYPADWGTCEACDRWWPRGGEPGMVLDDHAPCFDDEEAEGIERPGSGA